MNYCIYLKDADPNLTFNSGEHIFSAGVIGKRKLPLGYVSDECNNTFSKMELKFMRSSIISLPRQMVGPGKRGSLDPKKASQSQIFLMNEDNQDTIEFGYISLSKAYAIHLFEDFNDRFDMEVFICDWKNEKDYTFEEFLDTLE